MLVKLIFNSSKFQEMFDNITPKFDGAWLEKKYLFLEISNFFKDLKFIKSTFSKSFSVILQFLKHKFIKVFFKGFKIVLRFFKTDWLTYFYFFLSNSSSSSPSLSSSSLSSLSSSLSSSSSSFSSSSSSSSSSRISCSLFISF